MGFYKSLVGEVQSTWIISLEQVYVAFNKTTISKILKLSLDFFNH